MFIILYYIVRTPIAAGVGLMRLEYLNLKQLTSAMMATN